jgi:elongation factor 1 alpha-like protein
MAEGGDDDDWELLEAPYEDVLAAFPKARESDIVAALRASDYDADLAIASLAAKKNAKAKGPAPVAPSKVAVRPGAGGGGGAAATIAPAAPAAPAAPTAPAAPAPLPPVPAHVSAFLAAARPSLAVAFIGHVDAGKSTLLGRLLFDLGLVSPRALARLAAGAREAGKASFAFAWVLDEGAAERARGVTIDVGTNFFAGASADVTLLDAPGHRDYVPTMMTAVAQADVAVLVVDATPGGFEAGWRDAPRDGGGGGGGERAVGDRGGQSREHALLARALGVTQLVVAVNKLDAPGVAWAESRFREIVDAMTPFLVGVAGFKRDAITFVPVSGLTGVNVLHAPAHFLEDAASARRAADEAAEMMRDLGLGGSGGSGGGSSGGGGSGGDAHLPGSDVDADDVRRLEQWYGRGAPTLVGALDALRALPRTADGPLRFCIGDAFAAGGGAGGVTVSGRVEGGWVEAGSRVAVAPGGASGVVKAVTRAGAPVALAASGAVVELLLAGFAAEGSGLAAGALLAWPTAPPRVAIKLKARVAVLAGVDMPLVRGQRVVFHGVAGAEAAVVSRLLRTLDKAGKTATRAPRVLAGGTTAVVRLVLARAQPLETFAAHKRLGRFVLRYADRTVAVGQVLKVGR